MPSVVFALCRYCGDKLERAREPLEICAKCENSPLCDRCGHPRSEHTQVYVRGVQPGCKKQVGDFQSLESWPCDCPGFQPVTGALSDATFASEPEPDPLELLLRHA
jgi:hypothetical protein